MRYKAAAAVLLALSMPSGNRLAEKAAALRLPIAGAETSAAGRIAEGLSLRKVAADWEWFRILQYCADVSFRLTRGAELFERVDRVTDFDPTFTHCFMFGGAMLMWECNRPNQAVELIKKGIAFNPEHAKLKLYLAAFIYSRMNDLKREIAVLDRLAYAPGAPFMLRRILANAYIKQGRLRHAAAICRLVLKFPGHPGERRWAAVKLKLLERQIRDRHQR